MPDYRLGQTWLARTGYIYQATSKGLKSAQGPVMERCWYHWYPTRTPYLPDLQAYQSTAWTWYPNQMVLPVLSDFPAALSRPQSRMIVGSKLPWPKYLTRVPACRVESKSDNGCGPSSPAYAPKVAKGLLAFQLRMSWACTRSYLFWGLPGSGPSFFPALLAVDSSFITHIFRAAFCLYIPLHARNEPLRSAWWLQHKSGQL